MSFELRDVRPLGPFEQRWPDATERFERGWEAILIHDGRRRRFRHGLGRRKVYGRERMHTVTWLDGKPVCEGVGVDDHERSRALLSRIRRPDGRLARTREEIPPGYEGLDVVSHRDEIAAPYSPHGLAVKLREDDLGSWAKVALARAELRSRRRAPSPGRADPLELAPLAQRRGVARALVEFEEQQRGPLRRGLAKLTEDPEADRLVHQDPFAFLLAVLFDQGVPYGRAWRAPLELRSRLGHLDPRRMLAEPEAVAEAIRRRPALHRFINQMARCVLEACARLVDDYGGDAAALWGDRPTARELHARLARFRGISQKKAAMAVMLLWRNWDTEIREMDGCDVAVDVHIRRVFLRAGLVGRDDANEIVAAARELWPALPGALDPPAWEIGRTWCHAAEPECRDCAITAVCPTLTERALGVRGA